MTEQQAIRDGLAAALREIHLADNSQWGDDADMLLASPVIRHVQAEAIREAARQLRASSAWSISVDSAHPAEVNISPGGYPTFGLAFAAILDARADRIENAPDV